jgi:alpha-glucuronidase
MRRAWNTVEGKIDAGRFRDVKDFLAIQEQEAQWWRDASLAYFATFSRLPFPRGHAPPPHPLDYYRAIRCPVDPKKPRCPTLSS